MISTRAVFCVVLCVFAVHVASGQDASGQEAELDARTKAIVEQAEAGDGDAQLLLGLMHAQGRGVLKASVLAHMWFNLSAATGHPEAAELQGRLQGEMTLVQIERATALAKACRASNYHECGQ